MKIGKLNDDELKRIVFNNLPPANSYVVSGPGTGIDCAVMRTHDGFMAVSSDPVTGACQDIGRIAVNISCNDIACCGISPVALMIVILAPKNSTEEEITKITKQISETANNLNVAVAGGHTEITDAVTRFVLITTAFGYAGEEKIVKSSGAKTGDTIIMTKHAALEGTAILANDFEEKISGKLSEVEILEAKSYINQISVVKEGLICGKSGVNAMHDITEGGVLGAVWEMAEASGRGCEIHVEEVPVLPVTLKICKILNVNPYKLISSGSMLISTDSPEYVMEKLKKENIDCKVIGKFVQNNRIYFDSDGKKHEILQPGVDELYKVIKKD